MTKEQMLKKFIEKNVEKFEEAKSGLEALRMLRDTIDNHVSAFEEISEIFQKRGLGDVWIDCPDCDSPVLLNYKDCNICGRELLSPTPVGDKPKSKKKAKKVEVEKVIEKEEEKDFPSEEKVNAMDLDSLNELIEKEELEVDIKEFKGREKARLKSIREAVNDAIDYKIEQENNEENEEDIEEAILVKSKKEIEEEIKENLEEEEEEEEEEDFDFDFGEEEEEE